MMRLLKRDQINDHLWNECIERAKEGQAFFYTWYLDACCPGWNAIVDENYNLVFPFAHRNKFGFEYIFQPYFTRHFGVISKSAIDDLKRKTVLDTIPEEFKYLDFCLHKFHQDGPEGSTVEKRVYQELDLNREYEVIQKGYHENLVRNLKKAQKMSYRLKENFQTATIVDLFRKYQHSQREEFSESDYAVLQSLMQSAAGNTVTYSWALEDKDKQVHCGAFFIKTKKQLLYLKGFSSPEGKKHGAMHHLFDQIIRLHAGQDICLDFGGSSIKSVARFYHSFGSRDCIYLRIKLNRLPKAIRWIKR